MLTVCTSATSTDGALANTTAFRNVVPGAATSDDSLQRDALVRATAWAEDFLGVRQGDLSRQIYSETLPAYGGQFLQLSRYPIVNLLKLVNGGTDTGAGVIAYDSSDVRIDREAGMLWRDYGFGWTAQQPYVLGPTVPPNSELETWYVEYAAGWVSVEGSTATCGTCTTSTGPTLPKSIETAICLKAREIYEGLYLVANQKIGDVSISYRSESGSGGTGVGKEAERMLAPFRRNFLSR